MNYDSDPDLNKENLRPIFFKYPFLINIAALLLLLSFPISVPVYAIRQLKWEGWKVSDEGYVKLLLKEFKVTFNFLLYMLRYNIKKH